MRKMVDAKTDTTGRVIAIKLEGNKNFTNTETVIRMAEKQKVDAVVVTPKKKDKYVRTRPDKLTKNNLGFLAN